MLGFKLSYQPGSQERGWGQLSKSVPLALWSEPGMMVALTGLGWAPPCALRDTSSEPCLFCVGGVLKNTFIDILLFGSARSPLPPMGLSLVVARWRLFGGFPCCGATGSSGAGSVAAVSRLPSCSTQPQLLRSTWDPPRPGLEPVSPALAGRFFTAEPPGKSRDLVLPKVLLSF